MKSKYFFALLSIFVLLLVSCKKEKKSLLCSNGSANFTHLGIGHELKYVLYNSSSSDDTMLITNVSTDSNGTYKSTISFLPSGLTNNIYYHACGNDLYTSTNGNVEQYDYWWISLNANEGDSWVRTLDGKRYSYKLYSKSAIVTTPVLSQTFSNCYKFSYQSSSSFFGADTIYFKPEIGIVYYQGFSGSYELASKNF